MRILVTGGAGYVGRYVVNGLLADGHEVRIFDAVPPPDTLAPRVEFRSGDICSLDDVTEASRGIDATIHLAGIKILIEDRRRLWDVNVTGTLNALEAAVACGVGKFLFASSICAYGFIFWKETFTPSYFPIDEDHLCKPDDLYGAGKLIGEQLCRSYATRFGLSAAALRMATVWIPTLEGNTAKFVDLVDHPEEMRDFLWNYVDVRDVEVAYRLALSHLQPGFEVYNIGAEDLCASVPTLDLIRAYFPDVPVIKPETLWSNPYAALYGIEKARSKLGFSPRYTWRHYRQTTSSRA